MPTTDDPTTEPWFTSRWRPAIAWLYFVVCACDFIFFPVMSAVFYANHGQFTEWKPLTLQGGGLFHMSMGAIIGVSAWQRTQEKLASFSGPMGGGMIGSVQTDSVTSTSSTKTVTPAADQAGKSSRAD